MTLTDELARSFFDLWHHLDPAAAARFDPDGPAPGLVAFDRRTVRQHLAALRSLAAAAEALSPATLDEEIDQTLLLDAIRGVEHEFDRERSRLDDPSLWVTRLCEALAARPGDAAVLAAIPAWAAAAEAALTHPPAFGLELGLVLLGWALEALEGPGWQSGQPDDLSRARAALRGLELALRNAAPQADPLRSGVGEEAVDWRLHFGYTLVAGGAEALKQLARMAEERPAPAREPEPPGAAPAPAGPSFRALTEPGPYAETSPAGALDRGGLRISGGAGAGAAVLEARFGPAGAGGLLAGRSRAASEIRRRFAAPGLVEGWALYAEARAAERATDPAVRRELEADLHHRVLAAAVDLAVHRRQMTPADAVERLAPRLGRARALLEVRRIVLRPLEAAGSVLAWREWEALARRWPGGPDAMERAVLADGLASPALARWRHGVDG